jgi:uncharacterized protein (DUF362 family)
MAAFFDEVKKYHRTLIENSVMRALDELNIDLAGKKSAFIKVNIVRPATPKSCIITHPVIVEALINVLRNLGLNKITIGEGPAAGVDVNKAFEKSGYLRLAQKMNVRLLDINTAKTVKKEWDNGLLELPSDLLENDFYINIPKMKTHFHAGVTLSIKNQQGLLTPEAKKANHREYDLHESLVAIAKVIQPDLVIVDAINSMEGEGPTKGKRKLTKVLVYGDNMFETDIACCLFMGVSPLQIKHLDNAIHQKMASPQPLIIGKAFDTHKTTFIMPDPKPKQILNFYSWKNYRACAEDEHSFDEAIHLALIKPKYWFTFFPKFLYLVVFKRFDLLRGKEAKIPEDAGRTLCIGNCCKDVARKNSSAYFVPGCPPKPEDILKTIQRMK